MKIRQAQTSATYILPDPGELNKRVLIRLRVDMPADNFGVEPQYPVMYVCQQMTRTQIYNVMR